MPLRIDINELPTRFAEALARASRGDEVIVTDGEGLCGRLVIAPAAEEPVVDAAPTDDFWAGLHLHS